MAATLPTYPNMQANSASNLPASSYLPDRRCARWLTLRTVKIVILVQLVPVHNSANTALRSITQPPPVRRGVVMIEMYVAFPMGFDAPS